ncbi:metallophosphoesterase [Halomonas sp. I5-271120]|uniref:metallophosphoesterase n=1 Tax=Halomonas sp. I5-271120 TaxID=3061632 RepID=UPI0027146E3F|nr:metallophosphoesterase [Halomonas sp. I5-271120]
MRLVQVTDTHLHADPEARSRTGFPLRQLHAVLEHAQAKRPDVLLVTGDVSQDETLMSYAHAQEAFASLGCPWFWLPGNHDQPELMVEHRELNGEVDLGHWRLLLLDTRVNGQPHGELGQAKLQALAEHLEGDERPTMLVMHHPPVAIGSAWMDAIGLHDREALWQTLAAYGQVRAILCGHIHQAFASRESLAEGEVAVFGCPSTTDQFLGGSPHFAVDEASRPGYRVVDFHGDELTTWIERVDL